MRYASIRKMDISNGEGLGVSLFVQGCHFRCKNCFNQSTWDFSGGKDFTKSVKSRFLDLMDRPYIGRVSILGGEPLECCNLMELQVLIEEIKERYPDKKIWIYSGYKLKDLIKNEYKNYENGRHLFSKLRIIFMCDIMVDGQFVDELKDFSLKFRGSSNQQVIDIQSTYKNILKCKDIENDIDKVICEYIK